MACDNTQTIISNNAFNDFRKSYIFLLSLDGFCNVRLADNSDDDLMC